MNIGPFTTMIASGPYRILRFRGRKKPSLSRPPQGSRPFGATIILIDDHGVSYTKSADWTCFLSRNHRNLVSDTATVLASNPSAGANR